MKHNINASLHMMVYDCAAAIAHRMGGLLGWSPRRVEAELDAYEGTVRQGLRFRSE